MKVHVEFSGGLELLFAKQTNLSLEFDNCETLTLKQVVAHLRDKHLKEKPEFFISVALVLLFSSMTQIGSCLRGSIIRCKTKIKLCSSPHSMEASDKQGLRQFTRDSVLLFK